MTTDVSSACDDLYSGYRLVAEVAVDRKPSAKLVQQFLQGLHVPADGALLQKAGAQRVSHRFGKLCIASIDSSLKCACGHKKSASKETLDGFAAQDGDAKL